MRLPFVSAFLTALVTLFFHVSIASCLNSLTSVVVAPCAFGLDKTTLPGSQHPFFSLGPWYSRTDARGTYRNWEQPVFGDSKDLSRRRIIKDPSGFDPIRKMQDRVRYSPRESIRHQIHHVVDQMKIQFLLYGKLPPSYNGWYIKPLPG